MPLCPEATTRTVAVPVVRTRSRSEKLPEREVRARSSGTQRPPRRACRDTLTPAAAGDRRPETTALRPALTLSRRVRMPTFWVTATDAACEAVSDDAVAAPSA